MAKVVTAVCDLHSDAEPPSPATRQDVPVRFGDRQAQLDMCENHYATFANMLLPAIELGAEMSVEAQPRHRGPKRPVDESIPPCFVCLGLGRPNRPWTTWGGLSLHLTRAHGLEGGLRMSADDGGSRRSGPEAYAATKKEWEASQA